MIAIEKRDFIDHMRNIITVLDMQSRISDVARGTYGTRFECELTFPTLIDDVIELLENATNDGDKNIDYFLFEVDCGRKWKPGMIVAADGSDIPMGTLDDLWNVLVQDEQRRGAQKGSDV